jgi:hypothetical protein
MAGIPKRGYPEGPVFPSWLTGNIPGSPSNYYSKYRAGTGAASSTAGRPVGTQAVLGGKPVYWGGNDYGWQQLNQTGSSATLNALNTPSAQGRFIQDQASSSSSSSSSPAAERAYQQEASRVAQLTAQDPELKRYETARAAAKTQEEMNAARDIGMQIWAQRNPKLAAKVKPGQSGYEAIQNQINVGLMGAPADLPFTPDSLLGEGALQSVPSYAGASDLQPVGTPLPNTTFNTPENQLKSQMFNRFLSEQSQPVVGPPPTNPAEATYAGATNLQPAGDLSLEGFSFNTPAEQRRAALFASLLGQANSR